MLPLVHDPEYVIPMPEGHRFPMAKFGLLHDILLEDGVAVEGQFRRPGPVSLDDLGLVHNREYIDGFLAGTIDPKAWRRVGLPWPGELARRGPMAVGGTLLTAEPAMEQGLACNTAGGTHHAFPGHGSGFCVFNDLAVAARVMNRRGIGDIVIIDLDAHQGDGTAFNFRDDPAVFTFSMHCEINFPIQKQKSGLDIGLAKGVGDEAYLAGLERALDIVFESRRPGLALYDAGADPHSDGRLGLLRMSDEGLRVRDEMVLRRCAELRVPTACVIGGGYCGDIARLARRHSIPHRAADRVFREFYAPAGV